MHARNFNVINMYINICIYKYIHIYIHCFQYMYCIYIYKNIKISILTEITAECTRATDVAAEAKKADVAPGEVRTCLSRAKATRWMDGFFDGF